MAFDRLAAAADDDSDGARPPDQLAADSPGEARSRELARAGPPTKGEQVAAYWRAREAADRAYGAGDGQHGGRGAKAIQDARSPQHDSQPTQETAEPAERDDGDSAAIERGALRKRVSELEADKVAQDAKLADQAKTIAGQGERIERLEEYVGRITTAVRELRRANDEAPTSPKIDDRNEGTEPPQAKPQHRRHIPTDAVNNVIAVAAGGVLTELADHLSGASSDAASLSASGVALSVGVIAVWRNRQRKAKDDADDRPDD